MAYFMYTKRKNEQAVEDLQYCFNSYHKFRIHFSSNGTLCINLSSFDSFSYNVAYFTLTFRENVGGKQCNSAPTC